MKKRGKFLSTVIVLEYLFLLLSVIAVMTTAPHLFYSGSPYRLNFFNFLFVVLVRTISLLFIWKMRRWGVYVFLASHVWIIVVTLISIVLEYRNFRNLVNTFVSNVVLMVPLAWAIARKWKGFK